MINKPVHCGVTGIYGCDGEFLADCERECYAQEIAQALNDGERMRVENERLRKALTLVKCCRFIRDGRRFAADALREGAGYE